MRCNLHSVDPYEIIRREFDQQMTGLRRTGDVRMTVTESEQGFSLELDVPGFKEEDLNVAVEDGHLIISGERTSSVPENARTLFNNRTYGSFRRVLRLDKSIDTDSVDASIRNGVLTITLTRRPEVQPKKIAIRSLENVSTSAED